MKYKVYGINYNVYFCGGIANQKVAIWDRKTVLYSSEIEMLTVLIELKKDKYVGDIKVFEGMAEQIITDKKDYKTF